MEAVLQNVVHDVGSLGFHVLQQMAITQLCGGRIRMDKLACHGPKIHASRDEISCCHMTKAVWGYLGKITCLDKTFEPAVHGTGTAGMAISCVKEKVPVKSFAAFPFVCQSQSFLLLPFVVVFEHLGCVGNLIQVVADGFELSEHLRQVFNHPDGMVEQASKAKCIAGFAGTYLAVLILAEFCIVHADEKLIFTISHNVTSGSLRDCERGPEGR